MRNKLIPDFKTGDPNLVKPGEYYLEFDETNQIKCIKKRSDAGSLETIIGTISESTNSGEESGEEQEETTPEQAFIEGLINATPTNEYTSYLKVYNALDEEIPGDGERPTDVFTCSSIYNDAVSIVPSDESGYVILPVNFLAPDDEATNGYIVIFSDITNIEVTVDDTELSLAEEPVVGDETVYSLILFIKGTTTVISPSYFAALSPELPAEEVEEI